MTKTLLNRLALTYIALLGAGIAAHAQARADTRPPDKMPTQEERDHPPKTWIDKDTGHRVWRLTDEPGSASFYFNVNGYTPDGKSMVYTTPDGIGVLDLVTKKTRILIKDQLRTMEVGHKTPSIFYVRVADDTIWKANVYTGETHQVGKCPPRGRVVTVNADETLAAGTYDETDVNDPAMSSKQGVQSTATQSNQTSPLEQAADKAEMMEKRLAARIPLVLFTVDLTGSNKVTVLLHSTDWVNHLLFSPTDPTLLMYCHEGPWQKVDRIWTIRTDGTHNMLMHQRIMPAEIAGHEFWGKDGETLWYDLQTPKGEDFWLASYNMQTARRVWYHLQRDEWSIHFNVNQDQTLFTGDGGGHGNVAHAKDGQWIYLFRPQMVNQQDGLNDPRWPQPGVFHAERLVNMSKHNYTLEPNVSFTPDGKMVIFRSNMFGPTYAFGVEVDKAMQP